MPLHSTLFLIIGVIQLKSLHRSFQQIASNFFHVSVRSFPFKIGCSASKKDSSMAGWLLRAG